MEWAPHGIRVNSISPGFVRTQMTAKIEAAPDFQTKMKVSSFGCRSFTSLSLCYVVLPPGNFPDFVDVSTFGQHFDLQLRRSK